MADCVLASALLTQLPVDGLGKAVEDGPRPCGQLRTSSWLWPGPAWLVVASWKENQLVEGITIWEVNQQIEDLLSVSLLLFLKNLPFK